MRKITEIILHCSATPEGRPVTVEDIRRWHVENNGWKDIGYHYIIYLDGSIHTGRPEGTPGAHCKGHNSQSIGICYIGGLDADGKTPKDTRTDAQRAALKQLTAELTARYPEATIHGHNEFDKTKACPCFYAPEDRQTPEPPGKEGDGRTPEER